MSSAGECRKRWLARLFQRTCGSDSPTSSTPGRDASNANMPGLSTPRTVPPPSVKGTRPPHGRSTSLTLQWRCCNPHQRHRPPLEAILRRLARRSIGNYWRVMRPSGLRVMTGGTCKTSTSARSTGLTPRPSDIRQRSAWSRIMRKFMAQRSPTSRGNTVRHTPGATRRLSPRRQPLSGAVHLTRSHLPSFKQPLLRS